MKRKMEIPEDKVTNSTYRFIDFWIHSEPTFEERMKLIQSYLVMLYDAYRYKNYPIECPTVAVLEANQLANGEYNIKTNTISIKFKKIIDTGKVAAAQMAAIIIHEFTHFRQHAEGRFDVLIAYINDRRFFEEFPQDNTFNKQVRLDYYGPVSTTLALQPCEQEAHIESLMLLNKIHEYWPDLKPLYYEKFYINQLWAFYDLYSKEYDNVCAWLSRYSFIFTETCQFLQHGGSSENISRIFDNWADISMSKRIWAAVAYSLNIIPFETYKFYIDWVRNDDKLHLKW